MSEVICLSKPGLHFRQNKTRAVETSMEEHNEVVIPAVQGVLDWKSSMQLDISMVGKVK